MNPVYIAISSLALAVGLWLAWLLSRPCTKPLIDPQSQKALDDKLPPRCTEGNSTTVYTTFNPMLDALMDDITRMAVSLPEHTVVPYPNIPKKDYPKNIPLEVFSHEEKTV